MFFTSITPSFNWNPVNSRVLKIDFSSKNRFAIFSLSTLIQLLQEQNLISHKEVQSFSYEESFFEIVPIIDGIELEKQKDLSSEPLKDVKLPKLVYLLVDKKIELIPKFLRDYPEWDFLPEEDLNRKTIEIFTDLKEAKKRCKREERVIKVPNPNVFNIVAPILISKGISRLINDDKLIAL